MKKKKKVQSKIKKKILFNCGYRVKYANENIKRVFQKYKIKSSL